MRNRLLWFGVALGLLILIWWGSQRETSDTLADDFRFKVEDTSLIERILITDKAGKQVDLKRSKSSWTVNDAYPARTNAIKNLMDAIARVDLQYIPTSAATKTMKADLVRQGIRVDILGKNDEILKSYHVGGATPDERGTFMLMDGSDQPAVTGIPGWEGALRSRFVMRPVEWRSRMIFQYNPEEISRLTVDYPKQQREAFEIVKTEKDFQVNALYPRSDNMSDLQDGAIEAYLRGYRSIGAEAILEDDELQRRKMDEVPFAIIRCEHNSDNTTLSLYPIYPTGGGGRQGTELIERYHALSDDGTLYLIQHRIFEKLLWSYSSFFEDQKE